MRYYLLYKRLYLNSPPNFDYIAEEHRVSLFQRDKITSVLREDSLEALVHAIAPGCQQRFNRKICEIKTVLGMSHNSNEPYIRSPINLQQMGNCIEKLKQTVRKNN